MRVQMDRVHWKANMGFEMKIVERLADIDQYGGSFEAVIADAKKQIDRAHQMWDTD